MARNGFAEFLVARRAELRPADVGMPKGGRRRTPGLRREEVAVRAGVSADYLARLEQGRDINPSVSVVDALANALLLEGKERHHFGWLALTSTKPQQCPKAESAEETLAPTLEAILRALQPTPAFVVGRGLNVLGWNPTWEELAAPLGLLDDPDHLNLVWYVYTHPQARRVLRNWSEVADNFAAELSRADMRWPGDDQLREIIGALRQHPDFAGRWHTHRLAEHSTGLLRFDHPEHGHLDITFETLQADSSQSVVVWLNEQTQVRVPELRLVDNRAVNE
ncbi:helix-turn-helix transcriptional regulator [Nocardia australiensis]|uniref:helix-turn-helix transcriptional regulator n=1 Tax=Nocardia australiensis TaxID=2887191 RepID=UPI001D134D59|nr:helix-turn-helix transcriptional regulator [Nocardia australiensis]